MSLFRKRLYIRGVALVAMVACTGTPALGGTIKFPKDDPVIVLGLPEGWTATPNKDGDLDLKPPGKDGYSMSLVTAPAIHNEAEAKAAVLKMSKAFAEHMKLDDAQFGKLEITERAQKVEFVGVSVSGHFKAEDLDLTATYQAFEPKKGVWFLYLEADPTNVSEAHAKDYQAILDGTLALK